MSLHFLNDKAWTAANVLDVAAKQAAHGEIKHVVIVAKYEDGTLAMLSLLAAVLNRRLLIEMDRTTEAPT